MPASVLLLSRVTSPVARCILPVLLVLGGGVAHGLAQDRPAAVDPAELYAPTASPDRICLSWTGDPARSMSVTWRTDTSVGKAVAEVAPAEGGPHFAAKAQQVEATTQTLESNLGSANYHQADFVELQPETAYLYRVGDGVNWSEWSEFRTASAEPQPFSFVYFGDAQNDIKSHWSRVVRAAFRDAPRAAFFLHAGDLVNRAESDAEWGEWFYASGFIHRSIPALATPGNHEMTTFFDAQVGRRQRLSHHWRPTFAFPENGPDNLRETCYYLDYQGTRIVSLNSNSDHEAQAVWLRDVLSAPGIAWKVLTFHHPIYSAAVGRDNRTLRNLWQPVFDELGVDLVLQGHDHSYARTDLRRILEAGRLEENVPTGVRTQSHQGGTVYVVSVSGPKMYRVDDRPIFRSTAAQTQLYQIISIDGDRLSYRALTAQGDEHDAFEIVKHADGPNELIER